MAYQLLFDGPLLVIRLFGVVRPTDLDGAAGELLALEDGGRNTPPRLCDLRDVTEANISYADMARLAERTRSRPLAADVRSAIVVAQPVQLGFARMFQILSEHPRVTVHIFDDETAARTWVMGGALDHELTVSKSGDYP
jgi:hypothetical protein